MRCMPRIVATRARILAMFLLSILDKDSATGRGMVAVGIKTGLVTGVADRDTACPSSKKFLMLNRR